MMMDENMWYLQGQLSDNTPWIVPIYKNRFSIGREVHQDLILAAAGVSRRHAYLFIQSGELYLEDAGSRNGTFLNGSRIDHRTLVRDDDILYIGGYEFTIKFGHRDDEAGRTMVETRDEPVSDFARRYGLSKREDEVLYLLLRGKTTQEIGEKLFISPGTAKLHVQSIYRKTNCHGRAELITLYRGPL